MIGARRHRLTIQQDRPTKGPDGGPVHHWATLATVWAEGGPLAGRELWQARQARSELTHTFRVRWSAALDDLSGTVRLVLNGKRVLHLVAARDLDERRVTIELDCAEAGDAARLVQDPAGDPLLDPQGDLILEP